MRSICTSLGAWGSIEADHKSKHGLTFPLAIVSRVMANGGYPKPISWEGNERPKERAGDVDLLLVSMMDSRHFWRLAQWLREVGIAPVAVDRAESDPIVIAGGQAAVAPAPVEHMLDVVYIGEAEAHFVDLLDTVERGRSRGASRSAILLDCASVPGCLVPSHRRPDEVVQQVYADDISLTLREPISVSMRTIHRIELSRGCRSKCGFCALGWRSQYRENSREDLLAAVLTVGAGGLHEIHLSAADAESHSSIAELRAEVERLHIQDHGWTGRLDTVRDCSVSPGKQFAFGIEGMSHRLRVAVGKPRLTDDFIVSSVGSYWNNGGRRLMLHMIGGLPGETDEDADAFAELLECLAGAAEEQQYIQIGRQPFGPLPHTPMQWFAPGLSTSRIGSVVRRHIGGSRLRVTDKSGQTYSSSLVAAIAMRGGTEVQQVMLEGPPRLPAAPMHAMMRWRSWCAARGLDPARYISGWDPSTPTPWEHIQCAYPRKKLERAYGAIARRLGVVGTV